MMLQTHCAYADTTTGILINGEDHRTSRNHALRIAKEPRYNTEHTETDFHIQIQTQFNGIGWTTTQRDHDW